MDNELEVKKSTKKMIMYFIVFSITMFFGGLISAYVVSSLGQYWVHIYPPTAFWISNALIILSSVTMYLSVKNIRKGIVNSAKAFLFLTLILGAGFTVAQFNGWGTLSSWGVSWRNFQTERGEATSWKHIDHLLEGDAEYGKNYDIRRNGEILLFNRDTGILTDANDITNEPLNKKVGQLTNQSSSFLFVLVFCHILHLVFGIVYLLVNVRRIERGIINKENYVQLETLGTYWHFLGGLWIVLFFVIFSV